MSFLEQIDGFILTPQGFVRGRLEQAAGRISRISGEPVSESEVRNGGENLPVVLPGFRAEVAALFR